MGHIDRETQKSFAVLGLLFAIPFIIEGLIVIAMIVLSILTGWFIYWFSTLP